MTIFLSVLVVIISISVIFINQWITFFPQLGIGFQYRRRWVQISIAVIAISLATVLYFNNPTTGQLIILFLVLFLTPLSGFHHARRFLVAVDQPEQVSAYDANWDDKSLVIGYEDKTHASCAWLLETLVPHHLINDTVNEEPVLVAW